MEDNKSYVVLEPVVDFQHLEYVTVYRYRPTYAEAAQKRVSTSSNIQLEPLITARPIPEWEIGGVSDFIFTATSAPGNGATQTPEAKPTATPAPTALHPAPAQPGIQAGGSEFRHGHPLAPAHVYPHALSGAHAGPRRHDGGG